MNKKLTKKTGLLIATAVVSALSASSANASHFRGAALVPSVDANGTLTVNAKSFWRRSTTASAGTFPHSGVGNISISGGVGTVSDTSINQDITDPRRAKINEVFTAQLPGAGLYTMTWRSGSWVSGVPNGSGNYGSTSTIFWDGSNANTPIQFDLENIQQQVFRGQAYSDNLDVVGTGITYDDSFLGIGMSSQATGYAIDGSGQITIGSTDTATYADNGASPGADQGFSGRINAADGSNVEFVWLFDAVDPTGNNNLAPEITDVVINALVGDSISQTLTVTDPNPGDVLTTQFLSFLGGGGAIGNSTFDPNTLQFDWDSTGFGPGTYIANFRASDNGGLSDQGTITINLRNRPTNPNINEPGTLAILAAGVLGLSALRRRRKS